jgi:sugar phosphate permease
MDRRPEKLYPADTVDNMAEKQSTSHHETLTDPDLKHGEISTPPDDSLDAKVLRKCDIHVVPILTVLFLFAFLDRINIGNARLLGLEEELNMQGHQYNIALFVFFIPYILFEVPSNMLLKKIRPSTWLSGIMAAWGIVTVCQGVTESFTGLVVCRVLIGALEAGFMPGMSPPLVSTSAQCDVAILDAD